MLEKNLRTLRSGKTAKIPHERKKARRQMKLPAAGLVTRPQMAMEE
jgi:hypothetical protein